jgi:hypothetical protein
MPAPAIDTASSTLRNEHELVVCCARRRVEETQALIIRSLVSRNLDWDYVFRFARRHSVLPLLYLSLSEICPAEVPAQQLARLKKHYQENVARNLLLTGELCRLLRALEAEGIEAVPYKGPALAVAAYGRLELRRFVDLDIIVRKHDVSRAMAVLTAQGYSCGKAWTDTQQSVLLKTQHNLPLSREEGRLLVELHWQVASDLFASSLQAEELWERLEVMDLNGFPVKTLPLEDLLLSLCVHGSRHLWERLAWICDVAELLKSQPQLNWEGLLERANATDNPRMLYLGLLLAQSLLQAPLPEGVQSLLDEDNRLQPLVAEVSKRIFSGTEQVPVTAMESFKYNLRIREGWRSRLRYLRLMFRPTDSDVATVSLPPGLAFVYYLVRPLRLLRSDRERRLVVQQTPQH